MITKKNHRAASIGMFDGVHIGHRHLIDTLKNVNDSKLPPIVVTFTDHPLMTLRPEIAPRLLTTADYKLQLLRALGVEPVIMAFDSSIANLSAEDFLRHLKDDHGIDRLVLGFNNRFGHDKSLRFEDYVTIGSRLGVKVFRADEYPESSVSSSYIRKQLEDGEMGNATKLLMRPYLLNGTVVEGQRIGRTIGFPTANLSPLSPRQLIPATGVYAAEVSLEDNSRFKAAVNIGYRPTVDHSDAPVRSIEAHLIDFKGDIYGKTISIEFIRRIRGEQKFASLTELQQQLANDIITCRG